MKISGLILLIMSNAVWATNGFIPHGFGIKAKGMGGASIAYQEETHGASWNPAGLAFIGNRFDFEELDRQADNDFSQKEYFIMPELGLNVILKDKMNLGLLVYGNAGMHSHQSETEIDLSQLFFAPTLTKRFGKHAFGISLNMAYQRFLAKENFADTVSHQGYDYSMGLGGSIGWQGQFADEITLGAFYRSRTSMDKLKAYKGLLAENGEIDVPSAFGVGVAFHASSKTVVAFDVIRVKYSDVKAFSNPLHEGDNKLGMGFGWDNQTIYKLGLSYKYNDRFTLRAGLNYSQMPISDSETFFNQLAPEKHVTLGGTWRIDNRSEMSVFYLPSGENFGSSEAEQGMYQNSFGVSYGWHF